MSLLENQWRLLLSGPADGPTNMAIDEAIAAAHGRGEVAPTLRFYGWQPAAVSVGYFQSLEKEVDLEACRAHGVDWVRRPTGGRAIFHHLELTYSVAIRQELLPGGVIETYRQLSEGLLRGLQLLGLDPELSREKAPAPGAAGSAACFDAPSLYELTLAGKKAIGSAQTRRDGVILQHGSILLDLDVELLFTLLKVPETLRPRLVARYRRQATTLGEALARPLGYAEAQGAFTQGFAEGLGLQLTEGPLTAAEAAEAATIRQSKYATDEWNFRR